MLEYFSIFVIELMVLHIDISNYTANQISVHYIIMVLIWAVVIALILFFSKKNLCFPTREDKEDNISLKNWIITFFCLIDCKILTFIDWHTLKVVGEIHDKNTLQFCTQYLYYIFEVMLVTLIIIYEQKAIETLLKKVSRLLMQEIFSTMIRKFCLPSGIKKIERKYLLYNIILLI